jgi:hypothetical protein
MTLFENEKLAAPAPAPASSLLQLTDESINEKYVKGEVRIITEQARYPLTAIEGMVTGTSYKLDPDFQRRRRWDTVKKSRLIESFIMNVPIPPIFLYEYEYSQYEVMDGLQRMTAIYDFYTDAFPLQGLQEWAELNGMRYSQLPEQVRKGIDRRYLSSIILLQETARNPDEALRLKQLVFERINSGGIKLEPQETRNALYDGPLNRLCIRLARNRYLCRMWDIPEPTEAEIEHEEVSADLLSNESYQKMDDVELVLRFFAHRQRLDQEKFELKSYLDEFLRQGNSFDSDLLAKYEDLFTQTVKLVYDVLGDRAFWLLRRRAGNWQWYQRPTKVLYDPIMYVFSQNLEHSDKLRERRQAIRDAFPQFYQDYYDNFEGRSTNRTNLAERNQLTELFIEQFLA